MSLKGFSPSEDEMNLANEILLISDCQQLEGGALKSDAAIDIFKRSGLSYPILRDIWNIADENASGDLTVLELAAAIRLMGWVQAGEALEESLLIESGPLPTLDGLTDVVGKRNVSPLTRFPPINHDDIRRFKQKFSSASPIDGFLNRDIVLEIFMASSLSYAELWKIRKLVDVTERGALNFCEFAMGMYLIQALESCLIASVPSTVPPELHDLFSSRALFDSHPTSKRPLHSHRSSSSLQSSPMHSQMLLIPPTSGHIPPAHDSWDVSPIERSEANKHFQKLDSDRNGYIEGKQATNFMWNYNLSSEDLAHIWSLVDPNGDNRLTKDEFAVAMHLINRKVAGDEIPTSLPPSLVPPSMRSKGTHSLSPPSPLSPKQLAKFKSPPPPPPKRVPSRVKRSHSLLPINSATPDCIPRLNVPTSPLPSDPIKSPKVQSSFPTPPLSPFNYPEADLTSPFEDPVNGTSPSRHHSLQASKRIPFNHSNNEALEESKKEISRLTLQVDSLLSQLTAQNNLQDVNESLRKERDSLKAGMREMERTVSEVLSANDQNGSEEQYIQEIHRLSTELASKEGEHETSQRMLAVLTEEDTDLRRQLRESQAATAKAKSEIEGLRQNVASREGDITELRARLSDMGKEIEEGPESTSSNNRELRVLLRDVTRENDSLKGQVRDMQESMEQLLLSTKSHAKFDEVERENRRLQAHIQELEMIATQLQQSSSNNLTQWRHHNHQVSDEAARENEQLKVKLQTGHRAFAEFRSNCESTIDELQRKLATMEHENNQLKLEVASSSERGQADNSVPPPAYNDGLSIS